MNAEKFAQVCFVAQQVSGKALKALVYLRGFDQVCSHSLLEIAKSLELPGNIIDAGKKPDLYYISARYPDTFPSGAPYEYFTKEQVSFMNSLILSLRQIYSSTLRKNSEKLWRAKNRVFGTM